MRHAILLSACFILACAKKKDEQSVSINGIQSSSESQVIEGSPRDVDHLVVMAQDSYLNPVYREDGSLLYHEGVCLEKFSVDTTTLQMTLENMQLQNQKARCLMQLDLAYPKGYAFSIRRVEIPLTARIPVDSQAVFEGSYGFKGKTALRVNQTLDSQYSEKPLHLDHTVAESDNVWSDCTGRTTLLVDTGLSLNSSSSDVDGALEVAGVTPYRIEVIWAKCL